MFFCKSQPESDKTSDTAQNMEAVMLRTRKHSDFLISSTTVLGWPCLSKEIPQQHNRRTISMGSVMLQRFKPKTAKKGNLCTSS
jgi:hypothetical protein